MNRPLTSPQRYSSLNLTSLSPAKVFGNMGEGPLAKACLFAQQPRGGFIGTQVRMVWESSSREGLIGSVGATAGFRAVVLMTADRSKGVVILSNGPDVSDVGGNILNPNVAVFTPEKHVTIASSRLRSYAGTYANGAFGIDAFVVTERAGRLYGQQPHQSSMLLNPSRPDHFYSREQRASFEFVRHRGTIVGLLLTLGRNPIPLFRRGPDGRPMATKLEPAYPPTITIDKATLEGYAGTYNVPNRLTETIWTSDGHIYLQVNGRGQNEIYPWAKDKFYLKEADGQVTFRRDTSGNIDGLVLEFYGESVTAAKQP